jgi:ectoine hydroxylase-related dioxygenase (phytanoyl-CoA dioxygenase family)
VFEQEYVQLALNKGDAVFFNPALFHAAGANTSDDIHRMANLLQISSAFGRAMETIDRRKMCKLLYPVAKVAHNNATLTSAELSAAIAASCEGYSFPTNLDRDPPVGGLAPQTQQDLFADALTTDMSTETFGDHLDAMDENQRA